MITHKKEELVKRRFKRALRKHTLLFATQVLFSSVVAIGWYFAVWSNGLRIDKEDAEYFVAGVIFLGSAAWVLKGTEVLRVIWDQYREVVTAYKRTDETVIIELKDDHIPLLMHFYLTMLAVITTAVMMLMPYKSVWDGAAAVFLVTLIFTFFAAIVFELEDPLETGWLRTQLLKNNPELLDADSEEFFDKKWAEKRSVRNKGREDYE